MNWQDLELLRDYIHNNYNNPNIMPILRTDREIKRYNEYKRLAKRMGLTPEDIVFCENFLPNQNSDFVITTNEFPYNLSPGITHLLVWGNPSKLTDKEFDDHVEDAIKEFYPNVEDTVWFRNPVSWRSINGIPHVHLFTK